MSSNSPRRGHASVLEPVRTVPTHGVTHVPPHCLQRLLLCLLVLVCGIGAEAALASHFGFDTDPKGLSGVQHIVVLSRLGDTFHASWAGMTVFDSKFFAAPVPEWQTDAFVLQVVQEELASAATSRQMQPLDTSAMNLPVIYAQSGAVTHAPEVMAFMLDQARKEEADTLMVVEMSQGLIQSQAPGFGAYRHGDQRCIYTSFTLSLFRTDSGKLAAAPSLSVPCLSLTEAFPIKNRWDQYTPEEKAAFEAAAKQRIRDALSYQLRAVGLVGAPAAK
jgi:hypothetical protein